MEPEALQKIERVVAALAISRKYIQFYPPTSSNVSSVLDHLTTGLQVLVKGYAVSPEDEGHATVPDPEDPAYRPVAPDGLLMNVTREHLLYGDEAMAPENPSVRKLARDLYRLRVKSVHFLPGAGPGELLRFLELACLSSEQIEAKGGTLKALKAADIERIRVSLLKDLNLVDRESLPEGMDVLQYLNRRKETRQFDDSEYEAVAAPEGETEDISDIRDFFADVADGSELKRRLLLDTLTDPTKLATTLNHIHDAGRAGGKSEHEDEDSSIDLLRQSLHTISGVIGTMAPDSRQELVEKMGEAILTSSDRTRAALLEDSLAGEVGKGGLEEAVLGQLPDEEVAESLSHNVRFHKGTANTIANFLNDYSDDPRRRTAIRHMVAEKLGGEENDARVQKAVELLSTEAQHIEAPPSTRSPQDAVISSEKARNAVVMAMQLDPGELDAIEAEAESDFRSVTSLHAARTLLEVCTHSVLLPVDAKTIDLMTTLLKDSLEGERYDFVAEMMAFIVDEMPIDVQALLRPVAQTVMEECCQSQHLDAVVAQLRKHEARSPEFRQILYLLSLMGDAAGELLFKRLEKEENYSMRLFLVALFAELGDDRIPFLIKQLHSRHWYVVRNVAIIMGKIGSQSALDGLSGAVHHQDLRVRQEVLRAIAAIKGHRAEQMLIHRLKDNAPAIRRAAAEWLGAMGAKRRLGELTRLISDPSGSLLKDPEFAVGVVRAVGMLGGREEITVLKKFMPKHRVLRGGTTKKIIDACTEALARLEGNPAPSPQVTSSVLGKSRVPR